MGGKQNTGRDPIKRAEKRRKQRAAGFPHQNKPTSTHATSAKAQKYRRDMEGQPSGPTARPHPRTE